MLYERICQGIESIEILPTDIIIMLNRAWDESFADVSGNQTAISERGWNPLNRVLLLSDDLRKTITPEERKEEENSELFPKQKSGVLMDYTNEIQEAYATLPTSTNTSVELNFSSGMAAKAIERIVGFLDLEKARARNRSKRKKGESTKALLRKLKKLNSAGQLVRIAETHEIGIDLLDEINRREA